LLSRNGQPSSLMMGRIKDAPIDLKIGYNSGPKIGERFLGVMYCRIMDEFSEGNRVVLIKELMNCLVKHEAGFIILNWVELSSHRFLGIGSKQHNNS